MFLKSYSLCSTGDVVYSQQSISRGERIFFAYLLITYLAPLFINLIYDSKPIFRLPIDSTLVLTILLFIIAVSSTAILFSKYTPAIVPKTKGPIKPIPKWFIVLFSLISIWIGFDIFRSDLTQWRYMASMSDNSTLIYVALVQMMMPLMAYWVLITDHQFILSRSPASIMTKLIMLLGVLFCINGLGSALNSLVFVLFFLAPHSMLRLFYKNTAMASRKNRFLRKIGLLIILPIIIVPLFIAGSYSKSKDAELKEAAIVYTGLNYIINRYSVHLSSLAASIEDGSNYSDLSILYDATSFRIGVLTGLDPNAKRPDVNSFSRLALVQFADFRNIDPRGGSSPGLLASITMILPLPFSFIGVFVATLLIVKLLDFVLCRQPPFSWIGAFVFAFIPLTAVTDSPLDIIIPGPVLIVLILVMLLSFRRERLE